MSFGLLFVLAEYIRVQGPGTGDICEVLGLSCGILDR